MEEQFRIIANKLKGYEYVSFDLFDTLALRTVAKPTDIFALVERRHNERYGKRLKNFASKRIAAETRARVGKPEITIDDIYAELSLGKKHSLRRLEELEKETEIQSIVPYRAMTEVLDVCRAREQKIVITTDMYLDRATVLAILGKIGVTCDELFISGEAGCTKMSGELYGYVLRTLGISADRIVHVGDDKSKDVLMARRNGIMSLRCPIFAPADFGGDELSGHVCLIGYANGRDGVAGQNIFYDIGYKALGPFLSGSSRWLRAVGEREKCDRIAFVAREGYLAKQAYERAFPTDKERCAYICLNKNLLRFPIMHLEPTTENFLSTVPTQSVYTLGELFYYFGLNNEEKRAFFDMTSFGAAKDRRFVRETIASDAGFAEALGALTKIKRAEFERQYELFIGYIKRHRLHEGRTLLVNNSFDGNGQKLLCRIMELSGMDPAAIYGAQFACSGKGYARNAGCVAGYINDTVSAAAAYGFSKYSLIFERLLFEPQGTALELDGDGVVFEAHEPESPNDETIAAIGEHALEFVEDNAQNVDIAFDACALDRLMRLFERPTFDEALAIGDILDKDAHGLHRLVDVKDARLDRGAKAIFEVRKLPGVHWRQGVMTLLSVDKKVIDLATRIGKFRQKKIIRKEMKNR